MAEDEVDESEQDVLIDDVPAVEVPGARRRKRPRALVAVSLSLLVHASAAAGIWYGVALSRAPSLVMQGGTGTADFGDGTEAAEGMRDPRVDLPGDSASGVAEPVAVSMPLPDVKTDVTMAVAPHDTGDLLPDAEPASFPQASSPWTGSLPRVSHHIPGLPTPVEAVASPGAVAPNAGATASQSAISQSGVAGGGDGGGAGGTMGRSGSCPPVGLPGNRKPVYPPYEKRHGITGTVRLRIIVAEDGSTGEVSIVKKSGRPAMDESAVSTARGWRWSPALEDGVLVRVAVFRDVAFGGQD